MGNEQAVRKGFFVSIETEYSGSEGNRPAVLSTKIRMSAPTCKEVL